MKTDPIPGKNWSDIQGLIVDGDGVLFQSNNGYDIGRAGKKLGKEEITCTDWISDLALEGVDISNWETIEKISNRHFKLTWRSLIVFTWLKMVPELSRRFPLAISSNNSRKAIKYTIGRLMKYFNPIVTYEVMYKDMERHLKPYPDSLLFICQKWRILPQNVLFIGDSIIDEIAARLAGMPFMYAKWSKILLPGQVPEREAESNELSSPELLLEIIPSRGRKK